MIPKPLLNHLAEIRSRIDSARRFFLCLDFDGTLTPLADRPEQAFLPPPVRAVLEESVACPRLRLALVTGRALGDIRERVSLPGIYYAANHGLELFGPGVDFVEPLAALRRAPLQLLTRQLQWQLAQIPGALVEPKRLTTSVHYRLVPDTQRDYMQRIVRATVDASKGYFQVRNGTCVWEVRPDIPWNKGSAISWLRDRLGWSDALTIYCGDDCTDEDAFAALQDGLTIKVGPAGSTLAQYSVHGPEQVLEFLQWLAKELMNK